MAAQIKLFYHPISRGISYESNDIVLKGVNIGEITGFIRPMKTGLWGH
ncbi:MAG: hypothetical protein LBT02_02145 [Rickettsiales bacterium]|jgi:hypothetical protein|nr:hypothetical protein [Rickettsiales bacterium]